jgi:hypothetical protein
VYWWSKRKLPMGCNVYTPGSSRQCSLAPTGRFSWI